MAKVLMISNFSSHLSPHLPPPPVSDPLIWHRSLPIIWSVQCMHMFQLMLPCLKLPISQTFCTDSRKFKASWFDCRFLKRNMNPYKYYGEWVHLQESNSVFFFFASLHNRSTLKGKNLLSSEQILSFMSRHHYGRPSLSN